MNSLNSMKLESNITVKLIQQQGSDAMIAAAARVSTTGKDESERGEIAGLINYLLKHRHGSPFEHGFMTVFVHAPIFVFREWHRHRVGFSYNEESARYKKLDPVFYVPENQRPMRQVGTSARPKFEPMNPSECDAVRTDLAYSYQKAYDTYERLIAYGVAREVARACLPVGIYSSCYVTANPRSIMHFLSLRVHDDKAMFPSYPQYEIEQGALALERLFAYHWPLTYDAFVKNGRVSP